MNHAQFYVDVMQTIWDEESKSTSELPTMTLAAVSYVKTHSCRNRENAFDVLEILFESGTKMSARLPEVPDYPSDVIHDVTFIDGSSALITSRDGIGMAVEPNVNSLIERKAMAYDVEKQKPKGETVDRFNRWRTVRAVRPPSDGMTGCAAENDCEQEEGA